MTRPVDAIVDDVRQVIEALQRTQAEIATCERLLRVARARVERHTEQHDALVNELFRAVYGESR